MARLHDLHAGHVCVSMWFPLISEGEGTAVKTLVSNCEKCGKWVLSLQLNLSSDFSYMQWVERQEECCHLTYILHFMYFP